MKKEIIKLLKKLVKIQSTKNNPEKLTGIVDFCDNFFNEKEFQKKRFKSKGKESIVITFKGDENPEAMLLGHLDVVEGEIDQFSPKERNGRIYGRGTKDNKGSCAVMMMFMKKLKTIEKRPSVGLILTTDEEMGGLNGTRYILKKKNYLPKIAFVPDGGDNFEIIFSQKGVLHFKLIAKGRSAHGARPWEGDNAIDKLIDAYVKLRELFPNPKNKDDWKTSLNAGIMKAGVADNIVPEKAEMLLDMRFTKEWTEEKLVKKIKEVVGKDVVVKVGVTGSAFYISPKDKHLLEYIEVAEKILKRKLPVSRYSPASDARFFCERGIPTIMTNTRGGDTHGKREWVSVKSLEQLYKILEKFLLK